MGSFGAFPILYKFVSRKWAVVKQNRHKFGPQRYLFSLYGALLTVKCSRSESEVIQYISYFLIFNSLVSGKRLGLGCVYRVLWTVKSSMSF